MKMKHADIQWEQPAPKGHGFSLFLWVMVLLFITQRSTVLRRPHLESAHIPKIREASPNWE